MSPAVFSNVKDDMQIAQEEIFGPVMAVGPLEQSCPAIGVVISI